MSRSRVFLNMCNKKSLLFVTTLWKRIKWTQMPFRPQITLSKVPEAHEEFLA